MSNLATLTSLTVSASSSGTISSGAVAVSFRQDSGTGTINGNIALDSSSNSSVNFPALPFPLKYPAITYSTDASSTMTVVEVR